jgi:subtilisin family serine protease
LQISVAVIDSGVNPLPEFDGRLCAGVNLTSHGAIAGTLDEQGHGTIIARTILTVMPRARIVPIRVMDRRGALEAPELLEEAFAWIQENAARLGIGVVCAAFADTSHSQSDNAWRGSSLQRYVAALREAGIATVAAAGNWYPEHRAREAQGMAWPAILREAISVGGLERSPEGLRLGRTTQRLHTSRGLECQTTVFAEPGPPGETSGAAAVVAGLLASLRATEPEAGVNDLVTRLLDRSPCVVDGGLSWPAVSP